MDRTASPPARPAKRAACDRCHVLKSRCSRSAGKNETCDRCRRLGIECVSSAPLRTGRPRGSGLGLSSHSSRAASRSNENIPRQRSRDARSRERTTYTVPAADQGMMSVRREDQGSVYNVATDPRASFAAWQFPHLSNETSSLIGSDFSSSSLDGSMFSEGRDPLRHTVSLANMLDLENTFDPNSFTPMTTSSDDLTIEAAPSFPPNYNMWPDLAMNDLPYTESLPPLSQHHSNSTDNLSTYETSIATYRSDPNLASTSNSSGMYLGAMPHQSLPSTNQSREQLCQLITERMSSLLGGVNRIRTYLAAPNANTPLSMVDEAIAVTQTMNELLNHTSAVIAITPTSSDQSIFSIDWAAWTTNFANIPRRTPEADQGLQCPGVDAFFVQLDLAHGTLCHMYSLIAAQLKGNLQLSEANMMGLPQTIPADPYAMQSNNRLSIPGANLHVPNYGRQQATRVQVMGQATAETLHKLHNSLYDLICAIDSAMTQHSVAGFGHQHPRPDDHELGVLRSTLHALLLREEPLLAELRHITSRL